MNEDDGKGIMQPDPEPDADEADALISAAALRHFAGLPDSWTAPPAASSEGWIFGVPAQDG